MASDTTSGQALATGPSTRKYGRTSRIRVARRVVDLLRERLARGSFRPGDRLPSTRDLAEECRTSLSTVGYALDLLRRDGLVAEGTPRGTRLANPLDRLSPPRVAIVHPQYQFSPHSVTDVGAILRGFGDTMRERGYAFEDAPLYAMREVSAKRLAERFGAIAFVETFRREDLFEELKRRKALFVIANLEIDLDVDASRVDHFDVARRAVRRFVELGHRRIALVAREPTQAFYGFSRRGYRAGLDEAGLPLDPSLIVTPPVSRAMPAYVEAKRLFGLAAPPTAVFAARDAMAEGVRQAAEDAGLRVGRDVAVIGYDDYSWPGSRDLLATFPEPCYAMGAAAARLLIRRTVMGWSPPERVFVETDLIERPSLCPAPAGA